MEGVQGIRGPTCFGMAASHVIDDDDDSEVWLQELIEYNRQAVHDMRVYQNDGFNNLKCLNLQYSTGLSWMFSGKYSYIYNCELNPWILVRQK